MDAPLSPHSEEAEMGFLCSFLNSAQHVGALCAEKAIRAEHFYAPARAAVFAALMLMWTENAAIDLITITQRLRDTGELDSIGGPGFVTAICTYVPGASMAVHYAEILEEKRLLRSMATICGEFAQRARVEQDDPAALLSEFTAKIGTIYGGPVTTKPKTPEEIALDAADRAEDRMNKRGLPDTVIRTGLKAIDDAMSGIRLGDYVLISGREKSGKSSLAFNIFEHAVFTQKKRALGISLEMKMPELTDRLIAQMGRVNLTSILNGWMSDEEMTKFSHATTRLAGGHFQLRDDLYSLPQIVGGLRQYKMAHPDLELGIVDYLQLIDAQRESKQDNRETVIASISRTLRRLAGELNMAMIVLVQLNDDGQVRESRSPGMDCTAHIRIEPSEEEGLKWARIVYQRNGPSNVGIPLAHFGQFLRFEVSTKEHAPQSEPPKKKRRWNGDQ